MQNITDLKRKSLKTEKKIDHPGYFWLAYEWQNILLSCEKCNRPHPDGEEGAHPGKSNEFPVVGPRIEKPCHDPNGWWEELSKEEPLLLHPYYDQPRDHFKLAKFGVIRSDTNRGKATIRICDLNRPRLCEDRKQAGEILESRLSRSFGDWREGRPNESLIRLEERFSSYLKLMLGKFLRDKIRQLETPS